MLSRIYSLLAVNKTAVPYFALNSTSIIGQRVPLKQVNLMETCSEENFLKEFRMTRDEVKGSARVDGECGGSEVGLRRSGGLCNNYRGGGAFGILIPKRCSVY